jgi:hypothetical protein
VPWIRGVAAATGPCPDTSRGPAVEAAEIPPRFPCRPHPARASVLGKRESADRKHSGLANTRRLDVQLRNSEDVRVWRHASDVPLHGPAEGIPRAVAYAGRAFVKAAPADVRIQVYDAIKVAVAHFAAVRALVYPNVTGQRASSSTYPSPPGWLDWVPSPLRRPPQFWPLSIPSDRWTVSATQANKRT